MDRDKLLAGLPSDVIEILGEEAIERALTAAEGIPDLLKALEPLRHLPEVFGSFEDDGV